MAAVAIAAFGTQMSSVKNGFGVWRCDDGSDFLRPGEKNLPPPRGTVKPNRSPRSQFKLKPSDPIYGEVIERPLTARAAEVA
jgi:hypothetical protein